MWNRGITRLSIRKLLIYREMVYFKKIVFFCEFSFTFIFTIHWVATEAQNVPIV